MSNVTTIGTLLINDALPEDMRKGEYRLDKKGVHSLFMELAEKHPDKYKDVLQGLSDVGKTTVWTEGLSVSLAALRKSKAKEQILGPVREKIQSIIDDDALTDQQRKDAIVNTLLPISGVLQDAILEESKAEGSPFAIQVESGARGNKGSLASLRGADLLATDQQDNFIPLPLMRSYAEGFTPAEYFAASYGQRKGQLDVKMCLSGDTLVRMADWSVKRIDEIKSGEWIVGADKLGNQTPVRVTNVFDNGVRPVVDAHFKFLGSQNLRSDIVLRSTLDHKILTEWRSNNGYERDLVPKQRKIRDAKFYSRCSRNPFVAVPARVSELSDTDGVSESRAALLGVMLGDGCGTRRYSLSCGDPSLIADLPFSEWKLRPVAPTSGYSYTLVSTEKYPFVRDNRGRITGTGHPTFQWLDNIGLRGAYAWEKTVPDVVWGWSTSSIAHFVGGLLAADGCISATEGGVCVGLALTSYSLCKSVAELLRVRLGIYVPEPVELPVRDCMRRPQWIWRISTRSEVEELARLVPIPGEKGRRLHALLKEASDSNKRFGYRLDKIRHIGEERTWDLEVDHPDHLFVLANGLIVSNSTADAGFLNKQLVNAAHRQVITHDEPVQARLPTGLPVDTSDKDNIGSVLAFNAGKYKAGTILTDEILEDIRDDHDEILIYSPMTEISDDGGISAKAAGRRTRHGLHLIGDNIGIPAAQAIGERLSQGALSCLVEGTLVRMADWTVKRIEDIEPGDTVLGADTLGRTFPTRVSRVFNNGVQEAYRTTFQCRKRKRVIESTLRHKVLVRTYFSNHSEEVFNDQPRKLPIGKPNRDMKCVAPVGFIGGGELLREPLAYLLGALLGDGCYTAAVHGVHFSCADPLYVERFREWLAPHNLSLNHLNNYYYRLSQLTPAIPARTEQGTYLAGEVYNPAKAVLKKYGMENKYAHEKTLPTDINSWSNESVAQLIAGLIDTDGSLYLNKGKKIPSLAVSYSSCSYELCKGVRDLLELRFGIYPATICTRDPGPAGNFYAKHVQYSFAFTDAESVGRFIEHIAPYLLGCKREKAEGYYRPESAGSAHAGNYKRVKQVPLGRRQVFDIEVEHSDHLFVLANGLIVSNSKHSAGVDTKIGRSGMEYINRLIQSPENFPEAGPLVEHDGTVDEIDEAPQGGHYIKVGDEKYYAGPDLSVTVKVGDRLERGDDLTDGVPHPAQLVKLRGMGEARRVYMKNLREALENSGVGAHRRNIESVVAGLLNWAQITSPDGIGDNIYGDVAPYSRLVANYKPRATAKELPLKQLKGKYLEEPVLHYTPGTRVTSHVLDKLKKYKINSVFAHDDEPDFEPYMVRGMLSVYHDPDWRTRQAGFYTARAFQKSLHRGLESDTASTSFVPSFGTPQNLGSNLQTLGKYGQDG